MSDMGDHIAKTILKAIIIIVAIAIIGGIFIGYALRQKGLI